MQQLQIVQIIATISIIRGEEMYRRALRAYQECLVEIKSAQRDAAAAAREDCRYF